MDEVQVRLETIEHIGKVSKMITDVLIDLAIRRDEHDASKLESPEFETFMIYTEKLKDSTYGSDKYKGFLKEMKPALDHHYAHNRHHPEHFKNGIEDMNLLDLIEMMCDWKAATMRHDDGDIYKSLTLNRDRFEIDDQLYQVLKNTVNDLDEVWKEGI